MVDWERVQELRSKGWDWSDIAKDPKVGFHPDASAGSPGRALRALYHRSGRRVATASAQAAPAKAGRKEEVERKWNLTRIGWLLVPLFAVWFLLAYVAPSPIGLIIRAIPYLALALAAVAFLLIYALARKTEGPRWTPVYRRTVVIGVVTGLVVAGGIGLVGTLVYGCPYLPPGSSLSSTSGPGWWTVPAASWQSGGAPVVFYYAATWCPYCSASSWAIYFALNEFGTVHGTGLDHSSLGDVFPGTPEVVLAGVSLSSRHGQGPAISFEAAEDTSGIDGQLPGTASCFQSAYVSAYASGIPFLVINGQAVHAGTLTDPGTLAQWNYSNSGNSLSGASATFTNVTSESGPQWTAVQSAAWWMMAFIAKYLGWTSNNVDTYGGPSGYDWSSTTLSNVATDLGAIT